MKAIYNNSKKSECPKEAALSIMAQAIRRLFPHVVLAEGSATDKGFYYDVDFENIKLSDQDLQLIEAEMRKIGNENPEMKSLVFKITGQSGAYWKNNKENKMLTRINGIAFSSQKELEDHLLFLEEAEKRDHRKIGKEMNLFMFREEAPGFPFFLPKGMILKNVLIDYWREIHTRENYVEISTPVLMNRKLWETSGHWEHYKNNMYTTAIDEETYCMKPMNCPGSVLVYRSQPHSYRELPLRMGELGIVHRHELKGVLHGLFRVRCFTQDDAHIFMRREQITTEIRNVIDLISEVYSKFGFRYFIELSTRPADSMGSDEDWETATMGLEQALEKLKLPYIINEGDGAFYGPKIDFHLEDSLGRTWQCGTIQLDFQMPLNFGLEYVDENGMRQRPIMIHRVCFGSIERFIGILTEHFAGKFPVWLAPTQVKVLLVSEKSADYGNKVYEKLREAKIRCEMDSRNEKIGYMIREAQFVERVPYMIITGQKEAENGVISIRSRDTGKTETMALEDFISKITNEIGMRI